MDKEALKKVVLEILDSENENTFSEFLTSVAEHLDEKKTLKLDGIGLFQIRKEPLSRMERRGEESEKDILMFMPEGENSEDKLLSFDIPSLSSASDGFNDSVFDIGVNRPTIISDTDSEINDGIDSKLNEFIESGRILENFDILADSVPVSPLDESNDIEKEKVEFITKDIIDEENKSPVLEDDITEVQINKSFLNVPDEEEIEDEILENEGLNTEDDFAEVSSNFESEITDSDISESEIGFQDEIEEVEKESSVEEEVATNNEDINPFDELDDYIKEETKDEAQDILDEAVDEDVEDINSDEIADLEPTIEEETKTQSQSYSSLRNKSNEWYKKPILLLALFGAIIAVVVVFVFWPSSPQSSGVLEQKSENTNIEQVKIDSVKTISEIKETDIEDSKVEETADDKSAEVKKDESQSETFSANKIKIVKTATPKVNTQDLYRDIPNDKSITQRIYFDGEEYTVQSSSWKSTSIAEREVSKLKKRGFDAFIYKVFIKSKGSTWNRVRIGYFNTRKGAEDFLRKNKI